MNTELNEALENEARKLYEALHKDLAENAEYIQRLQSQICSLQSQLDSNTQQMGNKIDSLQSQLDFMMSQLSYQ